MYFSNSSRKNHVQYVGNPFFFFVHGMFLISTNVSIKNPMPNTEKKIHFLTYCTNSYYSLFDCFNTQQFLTV
jgi:hypothetical protein